MFAGRLRVRGNLRLASAAALLLASALHFLRRLRRFYSLCDLAKATLHLLLEIGEIRCCCTRFCSDYDVNVCRQQAFVFARNHPKPALHEISGHRMPDCFGYRKPHARFAVGGLVDVDTWVDYQMVQLVA